MTSYVFVDGAALQVFLKESAKTLAPNIEPSVDWSKVFASFGRGRILFYDAYPSKREDEADEDFNTRWAKKDELFRELGRIHNVHVRLGAGTRRRKKIGQIQKGVDVLLAIESYGHAMRGNIQRATFVLADLDFLPLFEALLQTQTVTELRYFKNKTNADLIEAADVAQPIRLHDFVGWTGSEFREHVQIVPLRPQDVARQEIRTQRELVKTGRILGQEVNFYRVQRLGTYWAEFPARNRGGMWQSSSLDLLIEVVEAKGQGLIEFDMPG
ncbi:NYN domain-containing protein [Pelagibius sp.]|uniref:NYN domain-containing protein n=1 Tax=Pelagibius sp. TaxID=1931238 RepID=UPI00262751BB|nr:NYN domain-containing protein [Pelagibius sp.]